MKLAAYVGFNKKSTTRRLSLFFSPPHILLAILRPLCVLFMRYVDGLSLDIYKV